MKPNTAVIFNGQFAYELIATDSEGITKRIIFNGMDAADYFEEHYERLGYEVLRCGDGHGAYDEWVKDYIDKED